ncbi:MAG TPA: ComF family protein [Candidatus Binataceae bacterium]|nr:ComF family protein [Candidatus Binataceae bacterium]
MIRYLINFIFPPRCAGCDARFPIESREHVCVTCRASVERLSAPLCHTCGVPIELSLEAEQNRTFRECSATPPHFTMARAIARYRSIEEAYAPLPSIIRRHQYGRDQALTHALAEFLDDPIPLADNDYDLIMPVPLHPERLRWRGFNQAALLAATVARRLRRPLDVRSLARSRATAPQTAKDRRDRHRNVCDAFTVHRSAQLANRRVLLVDDVMTTGSTADECARTLLAAGARRVDVLALARVI